MFFFIHKWNGGSLLIKLCHYWCSFRSLIVINLLICNRKHQGFSRAKYVPSRTVYNIDKCKTSIYGSVFTFSQIQGSRSRYSLSELLVTFISEFKIQLSRFDDIFLKPVHLIISQINLCVKSNNWVWFMYFWLSWFWLPVFNNIAGKTIHRHNALPFLEIIFALEFLPWLIKFRELL